MYYFQFRDIQPAANDETYKFQVCLRMGLYTHELMVNHSNILVLLYLLHVCQFREYTQGTDIAELPFLSQRVQHSPFLVSYVHNHMAVVEVARFAMLHNSPNSHSCLLWCNISSLPCSVLPSLQLARLPSPVQNLTVNVVYDLANSQIIANLSWLGPEAPYGKVDHYKIVLSSPRAASLTSLTKSVKVSNGIHKAQWIIIIHTTLTYYSDIHGHLNLIEVACTHSLQDTAAALDLTLRVEAHIVADLMEDECFNFSVRLHAR